MDAVKLPKKLTRGKPFVVIPQKEYERLVRLDKWKRELDDDLAESLEEVKRGEVYGPFETVDELRNFLENHERKTRPTK